MHEAQGEQTTAPFFRIWTCGAFRVEQRVDPSGATYEPVPAVRWGGSNYPRLLLKALLCCPGRRARREALLEMLWSEVDPEQATQYLNTAITKLRMVLRPGREEASLLITEEHACWYRLADQAHLWVDADEAIRLLKEAERVGPASATTLPYLEQAVHYLEAGSFLEGEEGLWLYGRRGDLDEARYHGRLWLSEAYAQQGMAGQAEMQLRALLADDPTDEDVLCRTMQLLHAQGLAHRAWRLFQQTEARLLEEGVRVSQQTRALAERLYRERPPLPETLLVVTRPALPLPDGSEPGYGNVPATALMASPMESSALDGLSLDGASWFGWQQAQMMTLIGQYIGRAMRSHELQAHLQSALSQLNAPSLPGSAESHQLSRRQALISLATLAVGLLSAQHDGPQLVRFAEEFLPQCAAGIMACQQLMKGREIFEAGQILSRYRPALEMLMRQSSRYQMMAAYLVLQCDNGLRIVASHRLRWDESERYSQHAVHFSPLARHQNMAMVAFVGLASDYFNCNRPVEALDTYQQALPLLKQISPLLQSNFYVKRAAAYAQQGMAREARDDIKRAHALFPDHPELDSGYLYADFGQSSLFLWEGYTQIGLTQHGLARPQEAWNAFAQVASLDPHKVMSERNRIEIINNQTRAALLVDDMELFTTYLHRGIEGATKLGSARRRQEAVENYRLAREHWPHEAKVRELAELFVDGSS